MFDFYRTMHYSAKLVFRLHVIHLSMCLTVYDTVILVDQDHIGWNTSKIISRLITLRLMLGLTPT